MQEVRNETVQILQRYIGAHGRRFEHVSLKFKFLRNSKSLRRAKRNVSLSVCLLAYNSRTNEQILVRFSSLRRYILVRF